MRRNPESPWNPAEPVQVSPEEYELQVVAWLQKAAKSVAFQIAHQVTLRGPSGEFEFDGVADLEILDGAKVTILIECKRISRPVEREVVLALEAKRQEVAAHKGMVVSTSGFQSGALKYAAAHGIACVTFINGAWLYETKSMQGPVDLAPPPWVRLPRFAGQVLTADGASIHCHVIDDEQAKALKNWVQQ